MFVPMLVLVVVMGFLRMRRSVHAKKNLPHQISKDKARLQSAKCGCPQNASSPTPSASPARTEGSRCESFKSAFWEPFTSLSFGGDDRSFDGALSRRACGSAPLRRTASAEGRASRVLFEGSRQNTIISCDGCDAAEIATDRLRCSRRSLDPDSFRDRRLHLSDRAGGSGISALGRGSERRHS